MGMGDGSRGGRQQGVVPTFTTPHLGTNHFRGVIRQSLKMGRDRLVQLTNEAIRSLQLC